VGTVSQSIGLVQPAHKVETRNHGHRPDVWMDANTWPRSDLRCGLTMRRLEMPDQHNSPPCNVNRLWRSSALMDLST
jgi:hypothetical protein